MTALVMIAMLALSPIEPTPFDSGVVAYDAGRFADAFERFTQALESGADPVILYNLGNCCYRLGRPAEAVYYYRRALLRDPLAEQAAFNLKMAEQQLGLDFAGDTAAAIGGWIARIPNGWLAITAGALQSMALVGWFLTRGRRRMRLMVVLCFVLGGAAAVQSARRQWFTHPAGVVLAQEALVRSEPHLTVAPSFSLGSGESVRVIESSDRWVHVQHREGRGWTERVGVGIID